jgi:hypothetical protein
LGLINDHRVTGNNPKTMSAKIVATVAAIRTPLHVQFDGPLGTQVVLARKVVSYKDGTRDTFLVDGGKLTTKDEQIRLEILAEPIVLL